MISTVTSATGAIGTPPPWPKGDAGDDFFGEQVADPFRWLEQEKSPDVDAFIAWQNDQSSAWIPSAISETFQARLAGLINYPRQSVPSRYGDIVVTLRNSGLQPHMVVFMQKGRDGTPQVLIDPNTFSKDGSVSLSTLEFTRDGELVAYGKSEGGSDNQTIYVRDVKSGNDLPDVLQDMRFSGLAWAPDNSGFWYNRYPDPNTRQNNTLYWHALGTDQADDVPVFQMPDHPDVALYPGVSDDGRYLFIYQVVGTEPRNGIVFRELERVAPSASGEWNTLFPMDEAEYSVVANLGSKLFVYTDRGSPRRKLMTLDASDPKSTVDIIPESEAMLKEVSLVDGRLVTVSTKDVHSVVEIRALDGQVVRQVALPGAGTVGGISARPEDKDAYFLFTSYTTPGIIFRLDVADGSTAEVYRSGVKFDPDAYETQQVFVERDGTNVPMFVTSRKGIKRDGKNPTLLYGYGGFGVSLEPAFDPFLIPWLDAGGVYAVANIRGGGEYGTAWHEAARLGARQVAFDDFAAAAKKLIADGITTPEKLAIEGGSNGGLLVLVSMLQNPDLFGAVVSQVPVTDMLRFHRFGTGKFWTVEYGNAESSKADFDWLKAYSPLHTIADGKEYPPLLVTTADGDDRVVPAHAFKFIAAIQSAAADGVYLLKHDTGTGHGGGKPLDKAIREQAEIYAFLTRALNLVPPGAGVDVSPNAN
ncbi:MAG: prolyl oligopeptidase family serine peptidase [Chthoniobacterales bacterium]